MRDVDTYDMFISDWAAEDLEGRDKLIREAAQRGQLTAKKRFEQEISEKLGRRLELRGPGRPKKKLL